MKNRLINKLSVLALAGFMGAVGAGSVWAQSRPAAAPSAPAATGPWQNLGREATPAEVRAWDIDVRPDFKGLPRGSGSVVKGQRVWEASCMSCHGVFGESNEVFQPIVGGTTAEDVLRGRVRNLEASAAFPQRSTMMKLSSVSTLWDYINRAMPWQAPKSLTVEEVYAVTAYILYLGEVVPNDFVLSDQNIAQVQQRLPNRYGKVFFEPLWRVDGRGDVRNTACMSNCPTEARVRSALPPHARNAHGDLRTQDRQIGPTRPVDTTRPAAAGALPPRPHAAHQ